MKGWVAALVGLAALGALVMLVAPRASGEPDGLTRVASEQGLDEGAEEHPLADGPVAGYALRGVRDQGLARALAAFAGIVLSFVLGAGVLALLRRRTGPRPEPRSVLSAGPARGLFLHADSPVHRVAAQCKLAAALLTVVAVATTPPEAVWAFGAYAAGVAGLAALARVPGSHLLPKLTFEVPIVVFAVSLPFVATGPRTEFLGVGLSQQGLWAAWNVIAKATLGLGVTALLAATTPLADLLWGLHRLGVPRAVTTTAGFMLRYLDLIAGELRRMSVARSARAADHRWLWQARPSAAVASSLFVRCLERAERVWLAMLARGFSGAMPAPVGRRASPWEWAFALGVALVAAGVNLAARW